MSERLLMVYAGIFVYFLWNRTVLYAVWLAALLILSYEMVRSAPSLYLR